MSPVSDASWDDYRFRVAESRPVTPVIRELLLTPADEPMSYRAGQYVLLSDADERMPPRSYSVANAPRPDGTVTLLVTRYAPGVTSTWVHDRLRPGEPVLLSGPYGTFTPDPGRTGPVLLLAAGSGLAPARAIAEDLLDRPDRRPVTLFFSARTRDDTIDDLRFRELEAGQPDFRYLLALTRAPDSPRRPRLPDRLAQTVGDLPGWEVFASGPPGFVTGCVRAARALGAAAAAVHTEEFFADPEPWTGPPPLTTEGRAGR